MSTKQTSFSLRRLLLLAIAVAGLGILGWKFLTSSQTQDSATETANIAARPTGGDFTLMSSHGPISLHDFKGKLVLLYFGYTYCPDICPTNLGNLSLAYRRLPPELQKQVQIIFVSVDPDRDTPKHLQQYCDYYQANMLGLTGTKADIDKVVKQYGVVYQIHKEGNDPNYSVDHSAFTYVIDPQGKWVTQLPHATSPDQFIHTINQSLKDIKND